MKYSFNTWMFSSYPAWLPSYPVEYIFDKLSRCGYDAVEFGCTSPHAWPPFTDANRRAKIKKLAKDSGLKFSTLLSPTGGGCGCNAASADIKERQYTIDIAKMVVDMAEEFECDKVLYVAGWYMYGQNRDEAWKLTTDTLSQIASYAEPKGVNIVVEPTACDSNLVECLEDARALKKAAGNKNLQLMFDTAHAFHRGEPPSDYIYQMKDELKHVHITDFERKAPGQGGYDFTEVMQALKDINYDGYVTLEVGMAARASNVESVPRQSIEYLKAIESRLK